MDTRTKENCSEAFTAMMCQVEFLWVLRQDTNVSEKHAAFIFKVKMEAAWTCETLVS